MKRITGTIFLAASILACSDDEMRTASISFSKQTDEIPESDGTPESFHPDIFKNPKAIGKEVRVSLNSNVPVRDDVIISFFVQGTASEQIGQTGVPDFLIPSGNKTVVFEKGKSQADIVFNLFEDLDFEVYENSNPVETILITLNKVDSGPAVLGSEKFFVLNVREDDAVVYLNWNSAGQEPGNQTRGDVDMDLILTFEDQVILTSAYEGTDPEYLTIPGGFASGRYGLSYNYYSGSSDDVLFKVFIWNLGGALNGKYYNNLGGAPLVYSGNLGLENIFTWSQFNPPKTVQSMEKKGLDYFNLSLIERPASGSRISGQNFKLSRAPHARQRIQLQNR